MHNIIMRSLREANFDR